MGTVVAVLRALPSEEVAGMFKEYQVAKMPALEGTLDQVRHERVWPCCALGSEVVAKEVEEKGPVIGHRTYIVGLLVIHLLWQRQQLRLLRRLLVLGS